MKKKKVFASVLASALVLGNLTLPENISFGKLNFGTLFAQAAEVVDSGTCGDDLTWTLDDEGTLTISGTGAMTDWKYVSDIPWSQNCESIKSVNISKEITSISNNAFYGCVCLTDIKIPDNVTSIGKYAFYNCVNLSSIKMPVGVTSIEFGTFCACISLSSIEIPASVTSIGVYAFSGCESLTTIKIPSSVTNIDTGAFFSCNKLTDVYYSGSEDEFNQITIGESNNCLLDAIIHYNSYTPTAENTEAETGSETDIEDETNTEADTDNEIIYTLGDVNQDNTINYLDAMLVLRYDAELDTLTDEQLALADVNSDGSVDSLDAILILRYDAGLIDEF